MQPEETNNIPRSTQDLSDWLAGLSPKSMREAFTWGSELGREVVEYWEKGQAAPLAPDPSNGS